MWLMYVVLMYVVLMLSFFANLGTLMLLS